jgi:hypothetical protein
MRRGVLTSQRVASVTDSFPEAGDISMHSTWLLVLGPLGFRRGFGFGHFFFLLFLFRHPLVLLVVGVVVLAVYLFRRRR